MLGTLIRDDVGFAPTSSGGLYDLIGVQGSSSARCTISVPSAGGMHKKNTLPEDGNRKRREL